MNSDEQLSIYRLLKKHENMFNGTLRNYTNTEYRIDLLEGAQPYHTKPFPIPKVHEETLRTEINRLVNIGVLKGKNNSEWRIFWVIITIIRMIIFSFLLDDHDDSVFVPLVTQLFEVLFLGLKVLFCHE